LRGSDSTKIRERRRWGAFEVVQKLLLPIIPIISRKIDEKYLTFEPGVVKMLVFNGDSFTEW
jgi:hypothetical protein